MPTAAPALVPTLISFDDDDDDDFGEFEFATPAPAYSSPPPLATSNQQRWPKAAGEDDDDDWGDFVESPLQFPPSSSFFDPFPAPPAAAPDPTQIHPVPPAAAGKGWKKPSGALPLSLFGVDDEDDGGGEGLPNSFDPLALDLESGPFASSKPPGSNGPVAAHGGGLKDLIASLYSQADKIGPAAGAGNGDGSGDNSKIRGDCGANSDVTDGGDDEDDELDESCWEFKDALSSSTGVGDSGDSALVEKEGDLAQIPGIEAQASEIGSGFQTSGNYILKSSGQKCRNTLGTNLQSRVLSDEREWGNAFVSHDIAVNGFGSFDFQSAENGCNGCISNAHHDFVHVNTVNGINPSVVDGGMGLDDSFWEFKGASSNIEVVNQFTEPESIGQAILNELEYSYMSASSNENREFDDAFLIIEGRPHVPNSVESGKEDVKAVSVVGLNDLISNMYNETCRTPITSKESTHSEQNSALPSKHNSALPCETLKDTDNIDLKCAGLEGAKDNNLVSKNMDTYSNISTEPTIFVDFYSRLKKYSCTLALHHIDNLKLRKADKKGAPDEELKEVDIDDEINAAFSKLGVAACESDHREKCAPNEFSVSDMLEVLRRPGFLAFDMEYSLSKKILLAEKDLHSAMWLFEHASYVQHMLTLASYKEQRTCIISWSRMASACELVLQHSAIIWSQAVHANIQIELLSESRGWRYFLAVGQIYRVVEILGASIKLYKPWILLNPADSRDMLTHMEKSVKAWTDSGLKHALEIISDRFGELKMGTKELLESIKYISELGTDSLQNHLFNHETHLCRLSLLPLDMLQDMKHVVWQGDHYFSKLANLWANKISCDAPQLPHIHVGQ